METVAPQAGGYLSDLPLVTAVIPTYNRRPIVGAAIDSALEQSYSRIEVVVVDDGSTDDTRNFLSEYGTAIHYLYRDNGGVCAAYNSGFDLARGELIGMLDSDDIWFPHKIERQVEEYLNARWRDTVVFSQRVTDHGSYTRHVPYRGPKAGETMVQYLLFNPGAIQTSTILVPTHLARQVRLRPEFARHSDTDFCIRLSESGARFVFIKEALSLYDRAAAGEHVTSTPDTDDELVDYVASYNTKIPENKVRWLLFIRNVAEDTSASRSRAWRHFRRAIVRGLVADVRVIAALLWLSLPRRYVAPARRIGTATQRMVQRLVRAIGVPKVQIKSAGGSH